MSVLSKTDLLERPITAPTERFHLSLLGGAVRLQGILSMAEYSRIEDAITAGKKLIDLNHPAMAGATIQEVVSAHYLLSGMIEPKLDTVEEALQFVKRIGPAAAAMVLRIQALSGVTQETLDRTEADLQANSFPADGDGALGGTPAPAPE